MLDSARCGDKHLPGTIMAAHESAKIVAGKSTDTVNRAENRPAKSVAAVRGFGEHVKDDIIRRVLRLTDLLNDHTTLALDLLVGHGRLGENVRQNVDSHIKIFGEQPQIIGRFLTACMCVHIAADIFHLGGDVTR